MLNANVALNPDHTNSIFRDFTDNERVEKFRLHITLCQCDLDNGNALDPKKMLMNIEQKYLKFK